MRAMFAALREFIEGLDLPAAPSLGDAPAEAHALNLAAAVLLVEVMRADASFGAPEREAVRHSLREQFALTDDEADRLAELADAAAARSTDLFAWTTRVDAGLDMAKKIRIVEHMWRVAYADGVLGADERHVLWRVADLLHVPQGAYVNARMRAAAAAAESSNGDPA